VPFFAAKTDWVWGNVCDVNAVRSSIAALVDAAAGTCVVVEVVWNVAETSTISVYVLVFCHGGRRRQWTSMAGDAVLQSEACSGHGDL
jgi:hypothetical protein